MAALVPSERFARSCSDSRQLREPQPTAQASAELLRAPAARCSAKLIINCPSSACYFLHSVFLLPPIDTTTATNRMADQVSSNREATASKDQMSKFPSNAHLPVTHVVAAEGEEVQLSGDDDELAQRMGHKSEFAREFKSLSTISFAFSIMYVSLSSSGASIRFFLPGSRGVLTWG